MRKECTLARYFCGKLYGHLQYEEEYKDSPLQVIEIEIVKHAERTSSAVGNHWAILLPILVAMIIPSITANQMGLEPLKISLWFSVPLLLGFLSIFYNYLFNDSVGRLEYLKMKREALLRQDNNS